MLELGDVLTIKCYVFPQGHVSSHNRSCAPLVDITAKNEMTTASFFTDSLVRIIFIMTLKQHSDSGDFYLRASFSHIEPQVTAIQPE